MREALGFDSSTPPKTGEVTRACNFRTYRQIRNSRSFLASVKVKATGSYTRPCLKGKKGKLRPLSTLFKN